MDTSGYFPILETSDGVDQTVAYSVAMAAALKGLPLVTVDLVTTDQTLGTGSASDVPIVWNLRNPDKTMNPDGARDRLLAPIAGWYLLTATVIFSAAANGNRSVGFIISNAGVITKLRCGNVGAPAASYYTEIAGTAVVYLAAGDFVKIGASTITPASSITIKANQGTRASMQFIRP